jgi:hypothetical protein
MYGKVRCKISVRNKNQKLLIDVVNKTEQNSIKLDIHAYYITSMYQKLPLHILLKAVPV